MQSNKLKKLGLNNVCHSACYQGPNELEVTIAAQNNYSSMDRIMTFNVKNNFTYPVWLHTLSIEPTEDGEIQNPGLFRVIKNTEEVAYQGRLSAGVRNYYSPEFYNKIEPGETYSFAFNPGLSFEMQQGGIYSVEYIGDLNYLTYDPVAARAATNETNSAVFFPELANNTIPSPQAQSNSTPQLNNSNFTLDNNISESTTPLNEVFTPVAALVTFTAGSLGSSSLSISRIPVSTQPSPGSNSVSLDNFFVSTGGITWSDTLRREVVGARAWTKIFADRGNSAANPGKYFEKWFGNGGFRNECNNVYVAGNCVGIGNGRFRCRPTGKEGYKNNKAGCEAACGKWERKCKDVSTQPDRAARVRTACQTNSSISSSRSINWRRERCPRGVLGYIYTERPNDVWICNFCFFENRAGVISGELIETILHEFFHFAGVPEDYTYDYREMLNLAKNQPGKAIKNAENYTIYCMEAK